jgi:hypothetical protein
LRSSERIQVGIQPSVNARPTVSSAELLVALRDLHSRHPEMEDLEAWELQSALFVLGYTNALEDEGEIAAAAAVARQDLDPDREAA